MLNGKVRFHSESGCESIDGVSGWTIFAPDKNAALSFQAIHAQSLVPTLGETGLAWLNGQGEIAHALELDAAGLTTAPLRIGEGDWALCADTGCAVIRQDGALRLTSPSLTLGGQAILEAALLDSPDAKFSGEIRLALSGDPIDASIRFFHGPDAGLKSYVYAFSATMAGGDRAWARLHPGVPEASRILLSDAGAVDAAFCTPLGGQIGLASIGGESGFAPAWDPVAKTAYRTPDGPWALVPPTSETLENDGLDLVLGLSGLEFASLPSGWRARFVAHSPALIRAENGTPFGRGADPRFPVTTAWVYFEAPPTSATASAATYHSQPVGQAYYYDPDPSNRLKPLPLTVGGFPAGAAPVWGAAGPGFPCGLYGGLDPAIDSGAYAQFETRHLARLRATALYKMNWTTPSATSLAQAAPGITGYTPQGIEGVFTADGSGLQELDLAFGAANTPIWSVNDIKLDLQASLLGAELFMVIDATAAAGFAKTLQPITIGGWTFGFDTWRSDTVMIIKQTDTPLQDLVADPTSWAPLPAGAASGPDVVQTIMDAIQTAQASSGQAEFAHFNNVVLKDWTGVLFLNAPVPATNFPPELQALTASIDATQFRAHHLGTDLSPVTVMQDGSLSNNGSLFFGLIFYENEDDLTYQGAAYAYKTLRLHALFSRNALVSFSSRLELLVSQLFQESSSLPGGANGDNLVLDGTMERHGDQNVYSFVTSGGASTFTLASQVLGDITVTKATFVPLPSTDGFTKARFQLSGTMDFKWLGDPDLFSFGPDSAGKIGATLNFTSLYIALSFQQADPADLTFEFQAAPMVLDPKSPARAGSLYAAFPLQASAMIQGTQDAKPLTLGYLPMGVEPLRSGVLGDTWFGVEMTLQLGNDGALADKLGLNAKLLAAWSPGGSNYTIAAALRLPGAAGTRDVSLEGPIDLEIGDISLIYAQDNGDYLLRMSNIQLKLFSQKFPTGGQTDMLIFGNPAGGADTSLGWYAAYAKDDANDDSLAAPGLAIARRRRRSRQWS